MIKEEYKIDTENGKPSLTGREPKWIVDVGSGCELGITTDDGCFFGSLPQ